MNTPRPSHATSGGSVPPLRHSSIDCAHPLWVVLQMPFMFLPHTMLFPRPFPVAVYLTDGVRLAARAIHYLA